MTQTPEKLCDAVYLAIKRFCEDNNKGLAPVRIEYKRQRELADAIVAALPQPADAQGLVRELLPYDVKIGGVVFRKGVPLETLVNAAARWEEAAEQAFIASTGKSIEQLRAEFPTIQQEQHP